MGIIQPIYKKGDKLDGVRQGDALSSLLFDLVLEAIFQTTNITGYI
jgi:hypothetical protein